MRKAIQDSNKKALADATGISYSKLRKYASGAVKNLTSDEQQKIYYYFISIAARFKNTN